MPPPAEHLTHVDPTLGNDGVFASTGTVGLWNNVPLEEQRAPGPLPVVLLKERTAFKVPRLLNAPAAEMGLMLLLTTKAIAMERVAIPWVTMAP